jgi:class 3 adenylate cyclase
MEKVLAIGTATSRRRALASTAEVVEFPSASERTSRTFVCTVLFLDLVEYSRKPVAEQLLIKERFNHHVSQAIHDIALADRIILDTGDGVAINFLGDPEDALVVALRLTDAFAREPEQASPIRVRAGINLGPVRLARDINSQPNIIGDGINVAQRVMSFAQPGQVLVSRSYHEVITRISDEYERLFAYQGSRTDKHVREHEIYELEPVNSAVRQLVEKRRQARRRREPGARSTHAFGIFSHRGLALGVVAGSALAFAAALLLMLRSEPAPTPPPAKRIAPAKPAPLAAPSSVLAMVPAVGGSTTSTTGPAQPEAAPQSQTGATRATPRQDRSAPVAAGQAAPALSVAPEPAADEPAAHSEAAAPELPAPHEPPPARPAGPTALVVLAISPWGEVYVNGKRVGVSPPLTELELPKGKHRIEVRNGAFKPFEEDYELGSNETVRIKHKFRQPR